MPVSTRAGQSTSRTTRGPQSRPAAGAMSNAREMCHHGWWLCGGRSGDIHRSCRTELQRVPRRSLPFLNGSNALFHVFNSENITMQLSCNYILLVTLIVSIIYTQVLLKRKTKAKNVTLQTHKLQRAVPYKRFQPAVQVKPLSPNPCRTTRTNMWDTSWRMYRPLLMTWKGFSGFQKLEYWIKELSMKRKLRST